MRLTYSRSSYSSIKNRCPGYFQAQVKRKFTQTCGTYIEVPQEYRASQYDHTVDEYIKKKLSDRMFKLTDKEFFQKFYPGITEKVCRVDTSKTLYPDFKRYATLQLETKKTTNDMYNLYDDREYVKRTLK